jgi:hypothetical protein
VAVTPLAPALPPLAAALGAAALLTLALGLSRALLFPDHDLATRLVGAAQLSAGYGLLLVGRATALGARLLVARAAALSLVATAAVSLLGAEPASVLDARVGGALREAVHAAALGAAAVYAFTTSPARRPLRSESPTSPA